MKVLACMSSFRVIMTRGCLAFGLAWLLQLAGCASTHDRVDIQHLPTPVALDVSYHAGSPLSGPVDQTVELTDQTAGDIFDIEVMLLDHFPETLGQPLSLNASLITTDASQSAVLAVGSLTQSIRWIDQPLMPSHEHGSADDATDTPAASLPAQNDKLGNHTLPVVTQALVLQQATTLINLPLQSQADAKSAAAVADEQAEPRQVSVAFKAVGVKSEDAIETAKSKVQKILRLAVSVTDYTHPLRQARRAARQKDNQAQDNQAQNDDATQDRTPRPRRRDTETLVADLPFVASGIEYSVILPYELSGQPWRAMVVTVRNTGQPASDSLIENVKASLAHWREVAQSLPVVSANRFTSNRTALTAAFGLLKSPDKRRAALVFLAGRTDATLTGDLALVSDDLLLELLATRIDKAVSELAADDKTPFGWVMDRECFKVLVEQIGQRSMRHTQGVLLTYLGEVARRPMTMEDLLESLATRKAFETRLQLENLITLEDESPSSRVHAFNWLSRHDLAPKGYDPLASTQQRRDALNKAAAGTMDDEPASSTNPQDMIQGEAMPLAPSLWPINAPTNTPATAPTTAPTTAPNKPANDSESTR